MERICDWLEARPLLLIAVLVLIYLPAAFDASSSKPLWHDELYTYGIAQAPTLKVLWAQTRTLDLNPPLSYLLTRLSFRLFGVSTLAARLPEIAGFLLLLVTTFQFLRRRASPLVGFLAGALLLESTAFPLAVEARPYALLLGLFNLSLLMYSYLQDASRRSDTGSRVRRHTARAVLTGALTLMLLSHVFALVPFAILVLAELYRTVRSRRLDHELLAALLIPSLAILTFSPLVRTHTAAIFPEAFQPDGRMIFSVYITSIERQLTTLWLAALAVLMLFGPAPLRADPLSSARPSARSLWVFTEAEWVAIIGLLATPLVLMLALMGLHAAYFDRYGCVQVIGVTLFTVALLCRWTARHGRPDPRIALVGALLALLISGTPMVVPARVHQQGWRSALTRFEPRIKPCQACLRTAALDPTLPLVDTSGLTFVEMNHNESPEVLNRLYYLTDPDASLTLAHANIFERMPEVLAAFHLAGHSLPYRTFLAQHPHFFVFGEYDYPEDWLLRQLQADGARIRVLGRTNDSYRDKELYEVTVAPRP